MTEADNHGCATCRFAKFKMTKHKPPRIDHNYHGECNWPLPRLPLLPLSVDQPHLNRSVIWSNWANCPVWEKKP